MTTDTCRKRVEKTGQINGKTFSITGVAKGSGMIRLDMASMLAYVFTDVKISSGDLKASLTRANSTTFNRITIDGDTSTNDTLLILVNGASVVDINDAESL